MRGANNDSQRYWNEVAGAGWARQAEVVDRLFADPTQRALDTIDWSQVRSVVDLACGCGGLALAAAQRTSSPIWGMDFSEPMLECARQRARAAGLKQLEFRVAELQTAGFDHESDLVLSRFGLSFFEDPPLAFRNLGTALRRGGVLAFLTWTPVEENPLFSLFAQVMDRYMDKPPQLGSGPGPFGLADLEQTRALLEGAGFDTPEVERYAFDLIYPSPAVAWSTQSDLSGRLGAFVAAQSPEIRGEITQIVKTALNPYADASGQVAIPAATWWIKAQRS